MPLPSGGVRYVHVRGRCEARTQRIIRTSGWLELRWTVAVGHVNNGCQAKIAGSSVSIGVTICSGDFRACPHCAHLTISSHVSPLKEFPAESLPANTRRSRLIEIENVFWNCEPRTLSSRDSRYFVPPCGGSCLDGHLSRWPFLSKAVAMTASG